MAQIKNSLKMPTNNTILSLHGSISLIRQKHTDDILSIKIDGRLICDAWPFVSNIQTRFYS